MRVRVILATFALLAAGAATAPGALATPKDDIPDDSYTCKFDGWAFFTPPIPALPAHPTYIGTFVLDGPATCFHGDIDGAIALGDTTNDTGLHDGTIHVDGSYNATTCMFVQLSGAATVNLSSDTESPLKSDFSAKLVAGEGPMVLGNAEDADGSQGEGAGWISAQPVPPQPCLQDVSTASVGGEFTVLLK